MCLTTNDYCRVLIPRLRSNRSLLAGCGIFVLLIPSAHCVAQPSTPTTIAGGPEDVTQVLALLGPCRVSSVASQQQCDERQPSGNNHEAAEALGVCRATGRVAYIGLIRAEAGRNDLPVRVADAVTYIESRYRPEKIGKVGEVGLMQIRPATAAMMGFRGNQIDLAAPEANIRYGVAYLARAWRLANGNLCRALMKYRAGHNQKHMTPRSLKYCALAKAYMRQTKLSRTLTFSIADSSGKDSLPGFRGQ